MINLDKSVENVKRAWVESPYYEDAEKWTPIFWKAQSIFMKYFVKLDVRVCAELACGYGRHSERLLELFGEKVEALYCLDLVDANVARTQKRLERFRQVVCCVNDGKNFRPIPDNTLTGIFCYDAMVHFSQDIVRSYIQDLPRVLRSGGIALFHHSNLDAPNTGMNYGANPHARNHMTMEIFSSLIQESHLTLMESETLPWGNVPGLDRISLIQRP